MSIERFFTETVDVYAPAESTSDTGFSSEKYSLKQANVAGSLQQRSGNYRNAAQGEIIEQDRMFYTRADAPIAEDDVLKFGELLYVVTSVSNMLGHHLECSVRRSTGTLTLE